MTTSLEDVDRVQWARATARRLLAEPLPRRWSHVQGVSHKAESVAHIVGGDADLLTCAAWLHDIGYAPDLVETGFHPLDGARYLRDAEHADDRLCSLVAYHSCAHIEARNRGLMDELAGEFEPIDGLLADALMYCDMTTTPDGEPIGVDARLAEILTRYGPGDVVYKSMHTASPQIIKTVHRIHQMI